MSVKRVVRAAELNKWWAKRTGLVDLQAQGGITVVKYPCHRRAETGYRNDIDARSIPAQLKRNDFPARNVVARRLRFFG